MNRVFKIISLSCATAIAATLVLAQATPEELSAAVTARDEQMKARGGAIGVLVKMAQGEVAYDAAAAVEAATMLVTLTADFDPALWPAGSETGAVPESEALPVLFENIEDFAGREAALNAAAVAMQAAAAVDLTSLQGALGAIGESCGGCHELYRVPS